MRYQLTMITCLIISILVGCASDGVEHEEDYTRTDNNVEEIDSSANKHQRARYYFELGLKKAVLDRDTIGDWEGAITELNKAIELNPEFQKAYHYRAIVYTFLQWNSKAMKDINKALKLDEKAIESYFVRAGLYASNGDYKNAIKDLDTIISHDPDNGKAFNRRGYAKIELGDKDGGCQDLKKARQLGYMPENKEGDKLICD